MASNLSSKEGNSAKLHAKSKNRGLQGIDRISGGSLKTLGVLVVSEGSSRYSLSRSERGRRTARPPRPGKAGVESSSFPSP